jgi:hypothetical protein
MFKGTFCWHGVGSETGLSRRAVKYRVFFANRYLVVSTTTTRQECKEHFVRVGPAAHRSVGPGDSIEESETRLQLAAEHRMKTDSCRSILCIMPGSIGCDDLLLTVLPIFLRTETRSETNRRMCSLIKRRGKVLCSNISHTIKLTMSLPVVFLIVTFDTAATTALITSKRLCL